MPKPKARCLVCGRPVTAVQWVREPPGDGVRMQAGTCTEHGQVAVFFGSWAQWRRR